MFRPEVIRKRTTFRMLEDDNELMSSWKAKAGNLLHNVVVRVFVKFHVEIRLGIVTLLSLMTIIDLEDNCFALTV